MNQVEGIMLATGEGHRMLGGVNGRNDQGDAGLFIIRKYLRAARFPRFDVGPHVHRYGDELVSGSTGRPRVEPRERSIRNWHAWESADGRRFLHGGVGAFLSAQGGVPHAFGNPTNGETVVFFQSSVPSGRENYFAKFAAELLVRGGGAPTSLVNLDNASRPESILHAAARVRPQAPESDSRIARPRCPSHTSTVFGRRMGNVCTTPRQCRCADSHWGNSHSPSGGS